MTNFNFVNLRKLENSSDWESLGSMSQIEHEYGCSFAALKQETFWQFGERNWGERGPF